MTTARDTETFLGTIEMDTQTYAIREVKHRVYDIYRADQMDQDPIGRGHYGDGGKTSFRWAVIADSSGSWIDNFRAKFVALVEAHLAH